MPRFASADDERAWWERHATEVEGTDLDRNPFADRAAKVAYSLRLDPADVERLEAEAARRGVRPTQLARDLIVAGLAADDASDPAEVADMLHWLERKVRAMATQQPGRKANRRGTSAQRG